ncbi:hypothetical protein M0811_07009 [Anaeramoeba ignava]|uniref:Uncharacterized protein n=1 Tax=Anaeramoeba ignava TaxID=1746090 RepID=A0A9Q0LMB3_ANAIG|nr:hypothetical protein M0811_07009 [Anaeramoeba ignava]
MKETKEIKIKIKIKINQNHFNHQNQNQNQPKEIQRIEREIEKNEANKRNIKNEPKKSTEKKPERTVFAFSNAFAPHSKN